MDAAKGRRVKEPRTDLCQLALLLSMPFRIIGILAIATGKTFAVLVGTAWVDSSGGFHWRGE